MLSKKEEEILAFIKSYRSEHCISPSYLEITHAVGFLSTQTTHGYVQALIKKGYLKNPDCMHHKGRSLIVCDEEKNLLPPQMEKEDYEKTFQITPKQWEMYLTIRQFIKEHRYPPTMDELCILSGLKSKSSVSEHVCSLEKKKMIERTAGMGRSIRILV